jgi:probable HAF family extracellular repeat protein
MVSLQFHPRAHRKLAGIAISSVLPAALFAAPPAGAATAPVYMITDLGALSAADSSVATAINSTGVVVGYSLDSSGHSRAVRWSGGAITDLGTLPGGSNSRANAINTAGQIAGTADRPTTLYGYPVRWSISGTIQDLGGPIANRLGVGNGIDPIDRVVGGQRPADSEGSPIAIRYDEAGQPTELGNPPDSIGAANAINPVGQIVGGSPAFMWRGGTTTLLPGLPGGQGTTATAINISGQIVGAATAAGSPDQHAVSWKSGVVTDLGTVGGIARNQANGVNDAGQVVGTADPQCSPCAAPQAWIRQPGGTITALDTLIAPGSGWTLQQANGINVKGQIVGAGLHNGKLHAFVLTPVFSATVNFASTGAPVPSGYAADTGAVYGPRTGGLTYGWNIDNAANGRDRNSSSSPDQRYDSFGQMQRPGSATSWELAVPDGSYLVHLVAGDPSYTDSTYKISAEGVVAVSGTPSASAHWFEGTVRVTVSDGRLTITSASGSANNKINYIDVVGA